eukprot:TRINITY_DN14031_c0_g1_i7.p1 TRINITY_DN14031_c0_g1~~TRINITY_DN14031_c0_g1_i7.p1  ORF type:complete len:676 (-),score=293.84 TRINITY_DN14031_c0_g1_i7:195-2222(-)
MCIRDRYQRRVRETWVRQASAAPYNHRMSKRPREETDEAPPPVGGDATDLALSVDETNKLRAELGLKPLEEGKTDEAKENWLKEEAERAEKASSAELAKKLEKAKNKRELNKKSGRKSIAEEAREAGEEMSAAEWVKHNKKKVSEQERLAAQKAAMFDEADEEAYDASDLAGLTVAHSADELKDGQTVILTLKDESILTGTGDYIERQDKADELENVQLVDSQMAKRNNKRKGYSAGDRGYNPFDDHEFNEDGTINTKKRSILEKYDDDNERNRKALLEDKKKIVITQDGVGKVAESVMKPEEEQDEQAAALKAKIAETLSIKFNTIKEQYTKEEVASFKKSDTGKKMRKKKKMRSKKETIEWDATPDEGVVSKDHGSRGASTKNKAEALSVQAKLAENKAKYSKALSKAYDHSQKLIDEDEPSEEEPEDDELQQSLARARRLELAKPKKVELSDYMRQAPEEEKKARAGEMVLTDTIEFCRGIELVEDAPKKKKEIVMDEDKPAEEQDGEEEEQEEEEEESEDEEESFTGERQLGRGLAGALDMIRNRGALKDGKETVLGRNDDEKNVNVNDPDDGVALDADGSKKSKFRLEYRDKYGRLLSQKEAFRQLSYGFHGKGPGKAKIEARQRKIAEQQRLKKVAEAGETPTSMLALGITQKKTRQAHMVLGGAGRMD